VVAVAAAVSAAIHAGLLAAMVVTGGVAVKWAGVSVRATSPGRTFLLAVVSCAILMWASPRARAAIRRASASPLGFALGAMGLAWALSLGPRPTSGGHALGAWGPYAWLQAYVPGFDGLRVPARFAMIVALFGACAGAYGVRLLEQRPWFGRPALVVLCLLFLAESTTVPMLVNGTSPLADVVTPSGPVDAGPRTPPVYRAVAALPGDAVLAEFPFGVEEYELRYMLASSVHRKPLLNGYSGGFPLSYVQAKAVLGRVLAEPDRAWALLADRGVTHVVVHEGVFLRGDGARVSAWLGSRGARLIGRFGDDRLFAVGSR
jgi:hypothetical protein